MKLSLLLKAVYANTFLTKDKKGKTKKPSIVPSLLSSLFLTAYLTYATVLSYLGSKEIEASQEMMQEFFSYIIACFILMYFFLSAVFSLRMFFGKDITSFLPLPIRGRDLFLAKFLLSFYLSIGYGGLCLLILPPVFFGLEGVPVLNIVLSVFFGILMLFAISGCAFLLSMLLYRLLPLENKKGVEATITTVLVFCGVAFMTLLLLINPSSLHSESLEGYEEYATSMFSIGRFFSFFGILPMRGFYQGDILSLVLSFLIPIALILASLFLADRFYFTTFGSLRGGKATKKISASEEERRLTKDLERSQNIEKVLFRKEARLLFSQPSAYLPSLMSSLSMFLVFLVLSAIFASSSDTSLTSSLAYTTPVYYLESMMVPLLSYASVSLEKSDHEMNKTYPLTEKKMLAAKVLPSTLFYTLLYLVEGILLLTLTKTSLFDFFPLLFLGLFSGAGSSFFAFYVGCKRATFSWTSPAEITSRGIGPFLVFLYSFLLPGFLLAPYYLFTAFLPSYTFVGYLIGMVPAVLLMLLFYRLSLKAYQQSLSAE